MLAVGAYVRYTEKCKEGNAKCRVFYGLSLVLFAFGLMSKPMLVTLPFVLLLLDYWPLGRLKFGESFTWRPVVEKIPYLALATASSVVTFVLQDRSGVMASLSTVSLGERLANIPVAYARYVGKIFWPSGLAVFYGFEHWNSYQVAGSVVFLGLITGWVVRQLRARLYLAVGWFWFLGMLVPTIGLVQWIYRQSMADRYSYLPSVGISIMAAWGLCDAAARRPWLLKAVATAGVLAVAACAVLTPRQIQFWRNPVTLLARAADVSTQDCITCYNVGCAVMELRNFPRAARCFERALKVAGRHDSPTLLACVRNNLGCAQLELGQVAGAISNFESALALQPAYPQAYYNMGRAFLTNRQPDVAADCLQRAVALGVNPVVLGALAAAYAEEGKRSDAVATAQRACQLALARNNKALAAALESQARQYQRGNGGARR
jgi:tetratricopeptide (TPR) repeat protein